LLWESIEDLHKELGKFDETVEHHTDAMQAVCPVTHHLENGLYTREVFMPAGMLVVSFIHKQNHPSFFMSGENTTWTCVYRTDADTVEEAEKEVYTMDFRELPESVIQKKIWQVS